MTKRVLDVDPLSGVRVVYEEESDGSIAIHHEQDVTRYLERNKALANDDDRTKAGLKGEMWHYASIPTIVQMKWLKEHGVDIYKPEHRKKMFKLLNDPDYRYLKTTSAYHLPKTDVK